MFWNEDLVKKSYYLVVFCKKHGQTQNYFWQKHNSVCVKKINLSSWTSKDKRHPIWEMTKYFTTSILAHPIFLSLKIDKFFISLWGNINYASSMPSNYIYWCFDVAVVVIDRTMISSSNHAKCCIWEVGFFAKSNRLFLHLSRNS